MSKDNALHSIQARSVSFDANSMTVTVDNQRHAVDATTARAVVSVCVRYMRERQVVMSALQSARRAHVVQESKDAVSKAIKYYEKELNARMQVEVNALLVS